MRAHPISPVTEPMQYRAIGVVRGHYVPSDPAQPTRGVIRTADGTELEAVVLGRLLTLMRRHLDLELPHLWVVYPRSRDENQLHLQMVGVWEPSTLAVADALVEGEEPAAEGDALPSDALAEGDDYFAVRGELVYTRPEPGDLVVMDAAAEYRGYAADITRTIPVSGTYTAAQRQLYQLVRDAQDIAERFSKPGMSVRAATDSSVALRARGLAALGLVESVDASFDPPWNVNCAASPAQCRQSNLWMIHGITHGIGLAVHDPMQDNGPDGKFAVGDAFTIEPGIYVSTKALDVLPDTPKNRAFIAKVRNTVLKYQNTGVRIEDDYIITGKGLERISLVPREMDEIEALMKRRAKIQP
jgi:hypothetical protein